MRTRARARLEHQQQPRRRGRPPRQNQQIENPMNNQELAQALPQIEPQQAPQIVHRENQPDLNHIPEERENVQNDISRLYNDVKSAPSFSSKIAEFLRQNETSSLHKRIRRKFKRRKTITYYPYDICMADLAFYNDPSFVRANGGVKYILVFIDVFSKMCYVEPMKNKLGLTTFLAMENILKRLPVTPNHIITDVGTEFYNHYVQKLFKENGIVHYSLRGPHKASVAERMIQTLKGRLEKYFWKNKTKRYIDVLQQVINNYNKTPHRSIGMAPIKVNRSNQDAVFKKMYKNVENRTKPRLAIGDRVRIAKLKTIFEKGYTRRWSLEIYTIVSAKSRGGVDYYKVEDDSGNILPRQRYYYELNLVQRNDS